MSGHLGRLRHLVTFCQFSDCEHYPTCKWSLTKLKGLGFPFNPKVSLGHEFETRCSSYKSSNGKPREIRTERIREVIRESC